MRAEFSRIMTVYFTCLNSNGSREDQDDVTLLSGNPLISLALDRARPCCFLCFLLCLQKLQRVSKGGREKEELIASDRSRPFCFTRLEKLQPVSTGGRE